MANTIKSHWNEKWVRIDFGKPTKNCFYEISNYGQIKSIEKASLDEKLLKGSTVNRGLKILSIMLKDNTRGCVYVHRFVSDHFVKKPSSEHDYIIHLDYDRNNNKWNNLEWVTEEEWKKYTEIKPSYKNGRAKREKHYKLTETKVKLMKKMLAKNKTKRKIIAKNFGVTENYVYQIEKGRRWGHVTIEDDDESTANI